MTATTTTNNDEFLGNRQPSPLLYRFPNDGVHVPENRQLHVIISCTLLRLQYFQLTAVECSATFDGLACR